MESIWAKHVGGYTPFEFDVTQIVKPGDANVIALTANNEYRRGAWWHWGGISREVHLVCSNQQYILWQHVTTEPDLETGRASVSVAVRIKKLFRAGNSGEVLIPSFSFFRRDRR